MPPKNSSSGGLSEREMQLLCNYCRCMKSKPEIDMEKFANISGFGGVPSARANIGRLLAKILAEQETSGDASPANAKDTEDGDSVAVAPASKKKAGGRKRKTDAAATDDAEGESPTKKKASSTKRKSKAAIKAASEEDEAPFKSEAGESADDDA